MVGAIAGLQEHLKLAREYAMEGLYDTSVIFFDGAIAQLNKYLSALSLSLACSSLLNVISTHICDIFMKTCDELYIL